MDGIISAINAWKDLIIKVFGEYPLAAALVSILAVGAFLILEKKERRGKTATNILLILFGWAILVPLVGSVLKVIGKVWDIIEAVAPTVAKIIGSSFSIYEKHPVIVIVICAMGALAYLAWKKFRPRVLPNPPLRILAVVAAVIVAVHIASPLADQFQPAAPAIAVAPATPAISSPAAGKAAPALTQAAGSTLAASLVPQSSVPAPPVKEAAATSK